MKYQDTIREMLNDIIKKKLEIEYNVDKKMPYTAKDNKNNLNYQIAVLIERLLEFESDMISLNKIIKPQDNNLTNKGA